jgi:scaffold protein (connect acetoacetyl-CoA thiolase and HMG-CoA synthase)
MSVDTTPLTPVREGLFTVDPPALIGGRCRACGTLRFPFLDVCPDCQSADCEQVALSTSGTIFTFTIVHMEPPGYLGETPYAYGVIELPEGLRVTTTLRAEHLDEIAIGDRCTFELIALGGAVQSFAYRVAS